MATSRQATIAAIQAALQQPPSTSGGGTGTSNSPAAPHAAPGVTPAQRPKLTADEKRAIDAQRQAESDLQRQAERIQAQQQAQEDALVRSANATINALGGTWRGAALTLEGIPTPGSLFLPLMVLLIFFLLLLPVNGHTRLVWLWLTLTGNAQIQQSAGGGGDTSGTSTTTATTSAPAAGTTTNPPMMTGVEDINV